MHEEEDSETQDRIVEEDGEDDVISSTTTAGCQAVSAQQGRRLVRGNFLALNS